ncbi:MAG: single-stranded-DNA-specific exonuclease RecJ [Patescibacteria group bacterium]
MKDNWNVVAKMPESLKDKFPEINPIILQLLFNRQITEQKQIEEFITPDYSTDQNSPFLFRDMEKVLARIEQALSKHEKVVIHGDYDADGVCSTCLMHEVLTAIGIKNLSIYIPDRETEGYGLNMNTINNFIQAKVDLIITVDCGIANAKEIAYALENKIDTIITDHHAEPLDMPTSAVAIIDSAISSEPYPFKKLAGVGVAFKVAQALIKKYELGEGFEKWLLDLVAISTITDCMPLLGENRTLVKYGLMVLNKTKRLGLLELIKSIGNNFLSIDSHIVGFRLGPRLNAAGRMDHANSAYQLLATKDPAESVDLSRQLNQSNTNRQKITEKITNQAKEQIAGEIDESVYFAYHRDWPIGILGLVAGKISDLYQKPTFIITENQGEITGSGRSIEQINIIEAIQQCEEYLSRFGGHAQACGFSLKNGASLSEFKIKLRRIIGEKIKNKVLKKTVRIESEITLSDITWELMNELEKFSPFGEGNPKPLFLLKNLTIRDWQIVGQNNKHLRLIFEQDNIVKKAIGFNFGSFSDQIDRDKKIDIVAELDVNEWNGNKEQQLKIVDI